MRHALKTVAIVLGATCLMAMASAKDTWLTSYDEAVKLSKKTGKPILADFTGSDWCGWCIKLHNEVFNKPEFSKWASKKVILLELDFPQKKKQTKALVEQNQKLQKKYAIQGYPTILFLDAKGTKLGESGYMEGGPGAWTKNADNLLAKPVKAKG